MKIQKLCILTLTFFSFCFLFPASSAAQVDRVWATYYGGTNFEYSIHLSTDKAGNVYLAGTTSSTSGISFNGFQNTFGGGNSDAFLVKFDATGNRLWATYYGGSDDDNLGNIATDSAGNIYLCGTTSSLSGISSGGFQNTYGGGDADAYLVKFNSDGDRLWATYYGGGSNLTGSSGGGYDGGYGVATDRLGNVYMCGSTSSITGISYLGFQNNPGYNDDSYLVKFSSTGTRIWATYYGDTGNDYGDAVSVDSIGNVYFAGSTGSNVSIAFNGHQSQIAGQLDAFLVKFNSTGIRLWGTYYGGDNFEQSTKVKTDRKGNVYISGWTSSDTGIATGSGFQPVYGGGYQDDYVAKFDSNGIRLWASYYGGTGDDYGNNVETDRFNNVYLGGHTGSKGLAIGGFQNNLIGSTNSFIAKFDEFGNPLCATYFGNKGDANGNVAIGTNGAVYISETTNSSSGLSYQGFQNTYAGKNDAVLVKFSTCNNIPDLAISTTDTKCFGDCSGSAMAYVVGGVKPYVYSWNTIPVQTSSSIGSLCPGTYTLTLKDKTNKTVSKSFTIAEPEKISSSVSIQTRSCAHDNGRAVAKATGGTAPYSFLWMPYGGNSDTSISLDPGKYFVKITDANACIAMDSIVIANTAFPVVSFDNLSAVCDNTNKFPLTQGHPSGGNYYGTGVMNNMFDPKLAGAGTHRLKYIYMDGNCADSAFSDIKVYQKQDATFSGLAAEYCMSDQSVVLIPNQNGGIFSGAGISGNTFNPSDAGTGTHIITYRINSEGDCSASSTQSVTVHKLPDADFSGLAADYCLHDPSITLIPTTAGGSFSGSKGISGNTFNPSIAGAGTYRIKYTITNSQGCTDTSSQVVRVNNIPDPTFSGLASDYCLNDPIAILHPAAAGGTFSGAGISGNTFDPSLAGVGSYIIKYNIVNSKGCRDSSSGTVIVHDSPVADPGPEPTICKGKSVQIGSQEISGLHYQWLPAEGLSDATIAQPFASPLVSTTYSLIVNNDLCSDTASITVTVLPLPVPFYTYTSDSLTIHFNANNTNGVNQWLWDFGDHSAVGTQQTPTHTYVKKDTYSVTLIEFNKCGSDTFQSSVTTGTGHGTGIDEEGSALFRKNIQIYPNPFDKVFRVDFELSFSSPVSIEIYDITGQKIYEYSVPDMMLAGKNSVSIDQLIGAKGIYYLRLKTNQFSFSKIILKE